MYFSSHKAPLTECFRCGFKTPKKAKECQHCHGLSDSELHLMLKEHSENFKGNPALIKKVYVTLVVILLLLLTYKFIE